MSVRLGFVLLTHANFAQIARLVGVLDRMFDSPPIACHHDFSKSEIPRDRFGSNFTFVEPCEITGWGRFSLVEASVRGIETLFEQPNPPEWFVLLSAADYPVKSAQAIGAELAQSAVDAYVDHREVSPMVRQGEPEWLNFRRYRTFRFHLPFSRPVENGRFFNLAHPAVTRYLTPFNADFRCFTGSQWFTANARAAEAILRFHRDRPALARHYRRQESYRLICPDESYLQTILGNAEGLRLDGDARRFIDWPENVPHPRTLGVADFERMTRSNAHFARKFEADDPVLAHLERHLSIG